MARAFVIDFNPLIYVRGAWRNRDGCGFYLQNLNPWSNVPVTQYQCQVKSTYDAKIFTCLMQQVQSFQRHYYVQQVVNRAEEKAVELDEEYRFEYIMEQAKDAKNFLEPVNSWNYDYSRFNYDIYNPCCDKCNPVIDIHELDVTKDFGPCYFVQEHKINGLYLVVMMGQGDDGLFPDKVKFIGSYQSLSKFVNRIQLQDADRMYQQNIDKYTQEHKEYYYYRQNQICRTISAPDFNKYFKNQTKEIFVGWLCELSRKRSCSNSATNFGEPYCSMGYKCPAYHAFHNTVKLNGKLVHNLFETAFGHEITRLVELGIFTQDKWHLMPNVGTPTFAKAFNKLRYISSSFIRFTLDYWNDIQYNVELDERKIKFDTDIQRIKNWLGDPNSFSLQYQGKTHTIPVSDAQEKQPVQVKEPTVSPTSHFPNLKAQLLHNRINRVQYPAILFKSPGETRIVRADDVPYMDTDGKNYWDTNVDILVSYNQPGRGSKQIGYRFTRIDLGYDFCGAMWALRDIQSRAGFKFAPSGLFISEGKSFGGDVNLDSSKKECPLDDLMINVQRVSTDYNGVMILDPQNMEPIMCEHYKLHTIEWGQGHPADTFVMLLDEQNNVSGIIYSRDVNKIIPNIITRARQTSRV